MADNRPKKVLKIGNIEAAAWEKTTQDGKVFYSYSFQKSYKNAEGKWANTAFFNASDLPALAMLAASISQKSARVVDMEAKANAKQAEPPAPEDSEDVPF